MKTIYQNFLFFLFIAWMSPALAQQTEPNTESDLQPLQENDSQHPCIAPWEYTLLEKQCAESRKLLGIKDESNRGTLSTTLSFPLRAATALKDCNFYYLSAGVDHNATAGAIKDYHCGTTTYDGHGGNDFSTWPYNFYKMDNNLVEVIAAAAGTILYKSDGHFDRYCAANSDTANYIVIRHADGSQANYFHMKKNSLTSKTVGQTVAAGEYLGVVGSSGNASGPHLHFEVWTGTTSATRIDPFSGTCNLLNANSWWASQKPYNETAVVKVSVNTTDAVFPACPTSETPNESNSFTIPFQGVGLAAGYAKFYAFITYDTIGLQVNLSILNSSNVAVNSWNYTSTANTKNSYRSWSKLLPTISGNYTFKASYGSTSCSTPFTIKGTGSSAISDIQNETDYSVYPNPTNGKVIVHALPNETITFYNMLGQKSFETILTSETTTLNLALETGVYLYQISNQNEVMKKGKMVVE